MAFFSKIKNIFGWIPILWRQDDTTYTYPLNLFKVQLINMANKFEEEGYMYGYYRIETIIKLMDRVYNYEYTKGYEESLKLNYGDFVIVYEKNEFGNVVPMIKWPDGKYSEREQNSLYLIWKGLFEQSAEKQKRAHKLFWKLIEHNIQKWVI
jgi:hypothetical protein